MSDISEGPGWWLASDGKWYPPQLAQGIPPPPPWLPTPQSVPEGPFQRDHRRLYGIAGAVVGLVVIVAILAAVSASSSKAKPRSEGPSALTFLGSYAHFSAVFPATTKKSSIPASFGDYHMQIYVEAAQSAGGPCEVLEEDVTPALPSDQVQTALLEALRSFADASGVTPTSGPASTTFRSYPAETASYRSNKTSHTYRAISFMSSGSRFYLVLAPSRLFSAFAASLKLSA